MPVLATVLKKDRMDVDIIKAALETLTILCTSELVESPGAKSVCNLDRLTIDDSFQSMESYLFTVGG